MAESKNTKKATAAAAKAETEETPQANARKEKKKSRWTLDTCQSAAKRFNERDAWAHGAPSSFKAAVAKGWDSDCCSHMTVKTSTVKAAKVAKPAAKVAAKAKAPAKKSKTA